MPIHKKNTNNLPPEEQSEIKLHSSDTKLDLNRENFLFGFLGHNRTGKTTRAKEIATKWKKRNPKGTVVAFDPQDKFQDLSDDFLYAGMDTVSIDKKLKQIANGLVILDDYKLLHQKERTTETWLLNLLQNRNDQNIDIIYITHNPGLIVESLTYFTTHYFVFYTESKMGSWEKKIPNYTLCQTASLYINEYVREHGRGEYPYFPHIIVETESEKLIAQNMAP